MPLLHRGCDATRRSTRQGLGTTTTNLVAGLTNPHRDPPPRTAPLRRLRAAARVVKRKMSNYDVKRPEHRTWPRPTLRPAAAIEVLAPPQRYGIGASPETRDSRMID